MSSLISPARAMGATHRTLRVLWCGVVLALVSACVAGLGMLLRAAEAADAVLRVYALCLLGLGVCCAASLAWVRHLLRMRMHDALGLARAAHELRSPLAALSVQLQAGLRGDAPGEHVLRDMQRTVSRTLYLADQLLMPPEALPVPRGEAACRLDESLRELVLALAPLALDKDLRLRCRLAPAALRTPAWRAWEVFGNLLANAIRHARPGTVLGVALRKRAGYAEVLIWNAGEGLAPHALRRLWLPFQAGPGGTGTGLGLAVCREGVAAMGGSLWLRNRKRNGRVLGVVAQVRLPLA
ncbi:Tricarboxylate transport sensor protein TctE [plant metagenome]|uniref:histidine kinase n=1 Tax=plant metagenome TaxID=1297885 RepID=A0A484US41_9ZZZZ